MSRWQGDGGWTVLMAAPAACPECDGSGWRLYSVETVEGEEEWAWELCPECGDGDAFPPKEGRVGAEYPKVFVCDHLPGRRDRPASARLPER